MYTSYKLNNVLTVENNWLISFITIDRTITIPASVVIIAWSSLPARTNTWFSTATRDIEKELEETLGKIKGVEDVKVLITYSETEKVVPIYNESSSQSSTQEKDTEGGERKIETYDTNKEVVSDANQTIITEKIMYPKMEGAIVIAKGAQNTIVKENITHAVEAATGLAVHKIQVFEMK